MLQTIASPYDTYTRVNLEADLNYFSDLVKKQDVELIVIGLAYNMDGTSGDRIEVTKQFGALLQEKLNLPIVYVDERLSSVEAEDILAQAKVPAIKRKGLIDKIAAGIILQNYINSR